MMDNSMLIMYRARARYMGRRASIPPVQFVFDELSRDLSEDVVRQSLQLRICQLHQSSEIVVEDVLPVTVLEQLDDSPALPHRWLVAPEGFSDIKYLAPQQVVQMFRSDRTNLQFAAMHTELMAQVVADVVQWRAALVMYESAQMVFVPRADLLGLVAETIDTDVLAETLPVLISEALRLPCTEYSCRAVQELSEALSVTKRHGQGGGIAYAWEGIEHPHDLWAEERTLYCLLPHALADYMSAVRKQIDADVCVLTGTEIDRRIADQLDLLEQKRQALFMRSL